MVGGGGNRGGSCLHSNRCLRVKGTYSIRRRDSDCSGGSGGSGGGTMAHSLWKMSQKTSSPPFTLTSLRTSLFSPGGGWCYWPQALFMFPASTYFMPLNPLPYLTHLVHVPLFK